MGWPELTLDGGIFLGLVGLVLTLWLVGRRLSGRDPPQGPSGRYVEEVDVLVSQTLLFGGMALMTLGNIAAHIRDKALPANPWLTLSGGVAALLLFGIQLGRLLMRWQVKRLLAEIDLGTGQVVRRS